MKPGRLHYFLALHGWKLAPILGAVLLPVIVAIYCRTFSSWALLAVLAALPLGVVLGFLFISPIIGFIAVRLNGGPFHFGDKVRILVGPYRDSVGEIYQMWTERNQVRVSLGKEAQEKTTDVFGENQIFRFRSAEPVAPGNRRERGQIDGYEN